jgi:hypothetical protein
MSIESFKTHKRLLPPLFVFISTFLASTSSILAYPVKVMKLIQDGSQKFKWGGSGDYDPETKILHTIRHVRDSGVSRSDDFPVEIQLPNNRFRVIPLDKSPNLELISLSPEEIASSSMSEYTMFGSKTNGRFNMDDYLSAALKMAKKSQDPWRALQDFGPGNSGAGVIYKNQGIVGFHRGSIVSLDPNTYCSETALNTGGVIMQFCKNTFGTKVMRTINPNSPVEIVTSENPELVLFGLIVTIVGCIIIYFLNKSKLDSKA